MKGIGFSGLLAILFIAFKLTHIIEWSWIWVLSPLWLGFALFIICFSMYFLILFTREFFRKNHGFRGIK